MVCDGCWWQTDAIHGEAFLVDGDGAELVGMFIDLRLERVVFDVGKGRAHFDLHADAERSGESTIS